MAEPNVSTKLCSKCKVEKPAAEFQRDPKMRSGLKSNCRECGRATSQAWRERNREWTRQYARDYAAALDPESKREKDRRRTARHPGRTAKQAKLWRQNNREAVRKRNAAWKRANRHKVRLEAKNRYWKDPDKDLAKQHAKRVRRAQAPGSFTADDVAEIRKMQRDRCAICRKHLRGKGSRDHVIPIAKGGSNNRRNIQLLCQPCNARKHANDPIEFMQSLGRLL